MREGLWDASGMVLIKLGEDVNKEGLLVDITEEIHLILQRQLQRHCLLLVYTKTKVK